jgi:hypothetical protein
MTFIDSGILDLTEKGCRRFQLLTGRTNVWLAVQVTNLSIVVYFVWAVVYFWDSAMWLRVTLGLFCGAVLYALTQTVLRVPIEVYESHAYRRVMKGLRNPRRVRDAPLRISFLSLTVAFLLVYPILYPVLAAYSTLRVYTALLTYSLIVLTTVVLYMLACDPLPPCPGKLREWVRGAARSRAAVPDSTSRAEHTRAERVRS